VGSKYGITPLAGTAGATLIGLLFVAVTLSAGLQFYIDDVDFEDVPAAMRAQLEKVPTRLSLPTPQVDISIAAGEEALRNNLTFHAVLKDMGIAKAPATANAPPTPPPTVADSN
jgi:hypothetical protein